MKRLFTPALAAALMLAGCEFDDSALREELEDQKERLEQLEERMAALEELTGELNAAIDDDLSIVSYTELPGGAGWQITFSDGSSLDVTHGRDGKDGKDGEDGEDGRDGEDGADGQDGRDGADGQDGRDGDDGNDGNDGDSLIESIEESPDGLFIVITLTNGAVYKFPKAPEPVAEGTTGPLSWVLYPDGTLTISGEGAMPNTYPQPWSVYASDIKTVIIEGGVTSISSDAFNGCTGLVNVTIPDSVTSIGSGTFQGCSSLESIVIPNSVTVIPMDIFNGCSSLTSVTILGNVGEINAHAFLNCTSLASVTIEGVGRILASAFAGCTSLMSVTIRAAEPPFIGDQNFFVARGDTLYVPAESVDDYRNDPVWGSVFTTIADLDGYFASGTAGDIGWKMNADGTLTISGTGGIPDYDYSPTNLPPWNSLYSRIETVVIESGVESIGSNAFRGCIILVSLTIPDGVRSIGGNAFSICDSLTSVTVLAAEPPTLDADNFDADGDTLYVPAESVDAYTADPAWSGAFTTIAAITTP